MNKNRNFIFIVLLFFLLFLLFSSSSVYSQTLKVSGKVFDSDNIPLAGAHIIEKGTNNGVIADFDGVFNISLSIVGSVLEVSYLGSRPKEIFITQDIIDSKQPLNIILDIDVLLDEVIVVGYGNQKKSEVIGAISSVKTTELEGLPTASVDGILQGQIAGVQITNTDASPNSNVSIRIRGVNQISGSGEPLVIRDGIQGVSMKDINPRDVASIEVLKDASATAVYGARGGNGVILITTKKGGNTSPSLTYDNYISISVIRKKLNLMNAYQKATHINKYKKSAGEIAYFSEGEIEDFKTGKNKGTDWQDEIFRNGFSQNHHLTLSGGGEDVRYNISGDYVSTSGIVENSSYKRYFISPYFSVNITKKLKIDLNLFGSYILNKPIQQFSRDREGSPIYSAQLFSPTLAVRESDGGYSQPNSVIGSATEYNPLALALEPIRDNISYKLIASPQLKYNFREDIELDIITSYQLVNGRNSYYYNEKTVDGLGTDRKAAISNNYWSNFQNTNTLTYSPTIKDKHKLKLTAVFEQQKELFSGVYTGASDFPSNRTTYNNLGSGKTLEVPYSSRTETSLISYMFRTNYSFNSRYIATLTGRLDASSVFAKNNKRGFFPSVAFGWNVFKEAFAENFKFTKNLKFRISYGKVGNASIQAYQSLAQFISSGRFSFDGSSLVPVIETSNAAPNPNLKWETTKQLNIGVDFSVFNGRASLSADYYDKQTEDLLLSRAVKSSSGFKTQLVNSGEVQNKGFEVAASGVVLEDKGSDFKLSTSFTFTMVNNKVKSLYKGKKELLVGNPGSPGFQNALWLEVGQPIGLIRGYEYLGVWKSDEAILAEVYGASPGAPKYADQNEDGKINSKDFVNIAKAVPDFTFGWNVNVTYKNLSLNIITNGVVGRDIYNIARSLTEDSEKGTSINLLKAWTPKNENTDIPANRSVGSVQRNSSRWVEDGSYFRVKNIVLGYNIPKNTTDLINIHSARLYVTATNLFTITPYTGFDPEANNAVFIASQKGQSLGSSVYSGVDLASYPSQKSITLGLNIVF